MVAKRAGQFAGGFLNNPGALAAIGIVVSIITTLVIFRKDISDFFGRSFGEAAVEGAGAAISSGLSSAGENITNFFTNLELPSFELPSFELPSFELPSFDLPTIEFPSFEDVFGEPSGLDFTDVGMAAARARQEEEAAPVVPSDLVSAIREPFDIIEETQAEFQERAAAFAEVLPGVTFQTSIEDGDIVFGRQLSRESEDFESVLAAEARRSETIFAGLFGNVQNPEFGA